MYFPREVTSNYKDKKILTKFPIAKNFQTSCFSIILSMNYIYNASFNWNNMYNYYEK